MESLGGVWTSGLGTGRKGGHEVMEEAGGEPQGMLMTYEPFVYLSFGAKDIAVGESVIYPSYGTS